MGHSSELSVCCFDLPQVLPRKTMHEGTQDGTRTVHPAVAILQMPIWPNEASKLDMALGASNIYRDISDLVMESH